MENKLKILEHLKDILNECNSGVDVKQIEHNVYEIMEHLGIKISELSRGGK